MKPTLISIETISTYHKVDEDFIEHLKNAEIINFIIEDSNYYLEEEELPHFEKIVRMYYDLHINMEGIEAIQHMLRKMESMQRQMQQLENRLRLYEDF
ncbi:MerR-like DNA binding protein [Balneicella halophila]|uniref:MerR-like DNA binding protein n=1 Tax=Balneicella halophila TaxID=1537566 RepID=A0A7L4UQN4_BALHA|nr:chaperone modulator CbpM [Balneicella halophila]PVX50050.1 MerR-like DNA binding protein [Balneicella halophila]